MNKKQFEICVFCNKQVATKKETHKWFNNELPRKKLTPDKDRCYANSRIDCGLNKIMILEIELNTIKDALAIVASYAKGDSE
jgi:hypothetical protein